MTEAVLAISNLLFGASVLGYFYFREVRERSDTGEKLDGFYSRALHHLVASFDQYNQTLKEISESKDQLFQQTLTEYLKHNERLEKMVLPQPVTKKAVQEVLDQMPNEIEKDDKELEKEQLEDLLTRIPITKDTKVQFEGDTGALDNGLAEEIMSGQVRDDYPNVS